MNLHRDSDWTHVRVTVAGIGIAGFAAADALMQLGAKVTIVDSSDGEKQRERAEILGALGATIELAHQGPIPQSDLFVVSPGLDGRLGRDRGRHPGAGPGGLLVPSRQSREPMALALPPDSPS